MKWHAHAHTHTQKTHCVTSDPNTMSHSELMTFQGYRGTWGATGPPLGGPPLPADLWGGHGSILGAGGGKRGQKAGNIGPEGPVKHENVETPTKWGGLGLRNPL